MDISKKQKQMAHHPNKSIYLEFMKLLLQTKKTKSFWSLDTNVNIF